MPYSLEKATALLVRELNASPDSPLSHPTFQNLLLLPAGPARDQVVQTLAQNATVRCLELPPAPITTLHPQDDLRAFAKTLRDAAQSLHDDGGGLLVINDLGRTSLVLQNVAVICMSRAALKKAGLDSVHVMWTADPTDVLPSTVVNQVLPMAVELGATPAPIAQKEEARVSHVRIPNLSQLAEGLPSAPHVPERSRPSIGARVAA